jgi:mono/diheme cytochrome c family protein
MVKSRAPRYIWVVARRETWAIAAAAVVVALVCAGAALARNAATPGDPVKGQQVFQRFCARCHNFAANGTHSTATGGVAGSDLDALKPTYSRVVTAIVQGEGGLPAEYFLARLTFQQIYDVAAFVSKYAGKPGLDASHLAALHRAAATKGSGSSSSNG